MYSLNIPKNVNITLGKGFIKLIGPKGTLIKKIGSLRISLKDSRIYLLGLETNIQAQFYLKLLNNLILGISKGYSKRLRLVGVGFKALVINQKLKLKIGFSHLIEWKIPQSIQIANSKLKNSFLLIKGKEHYKVSQIATRIRHFRLPDSYKGKGIQKEKEILSLKKGKKESKS